MFAKIKNHQQWWVVGLMVFCLGLIVAGGVNYVGRLRQGLLENAIQNLMNVTVQQQQDFDSFLGGDRDDLHDFAKFFANHDITDPDDIRLLLSLPDDSDTTYLVMCLDEGWTVSTYFDDIRQLEEDDLALYQSLDDSGVRGPYTGIYSGVPRFSYYEKFFFSDGHQGMIQKSYDRSKVSATFPLTFYNGRGLAHVVDRQGNILLRPSVITENLYDNIFDMLSDFNSNPEDIDALREALLTQQKGSITFSREDGDNICTYVSLENVEDWYLVSVVPAGAVTAETDQILTDFQVALGILVLLLFICAVFIVMIWNIQKHLLEKEQQVSYQTQLFDIFTTYLSNNTDDMYIMLDQNTEKVEYVSPNIERVLGFKPEEAVTYLGAFDREADPEAAQAYYNQLNAMSPGDTVSRSTERVNLRTGEHKYFLENATYTMIQGKAKRVCYLSDRTKERKIQDDLAEALRMARAANEAKSAFLSSVSHDIRTPMNAIIGFLALMRDEVDNPDVVMEYNNRIDAASQHLLGLINDVLDMNKIESGSATLNISELDLAEIIEEINTIIRPQAKAKDQTFIISTSYLEYEHLLGDKLRLNQILINLLSNSVKYTPEGGEIHLRIEELSRMVADYSRIRFTVRDNGLGMSQEYLKVIFDPFTREENKATYGIQGTGLGMAITKNLVDLMGGEIHVESMLGKGSTFTVELELKIQQTKSDPKFWADHQITRMIVADNDEETCRNIVKAMAGVGVETHYSTNGIHAVQMMRTTREEGRPYDLILLNWRMPQLNGIETARLIRRNYSEHIPILLLTAYDWSDIEQEAAEVGINHFMPKPFFMSTFKEAIRRVQGNAKKEETQQSDVVQGMHILVVDDIDVNRIILLKILKTLGADCETAGDGKEAVEKFNASAAGEFDLILMDVQMPLMDGYEATRTIRAGQHPNAKTVPIIAMTANAFVDDVRDAIQSGMDAHVAKPVQVDTLKSAIKQVLDNRKQKA